MESDLSPTQISLVMRAADCVTTLGKFNTERVIRSDAYYAVAESGVPISERVPFCLLLEKSDGRRQEGAVRIFARRSRMIAHYGFARGNGNFGVTYCCGIGAVHASREWAGFGHV